MSSRESKINSSRLRDGGLLKMRPAFAGAIFCAVARALVVLGNFGFSEPSLMLSIPSTVIGLLIGLLVAPIRGPLRAAIIGGIVSGTVFLSLMIPLAMLFSIFSKSILDFRFLEDSLPYALQMAGAGAIACGLGSYLGSRRSERAN